MSSAKYNDTQTIHGSLPTEDFYSSREHATNVGNLVIQPAGKVQVLRFFLGLVWMTDNGHLLKQEHFSLPRTPVVATLQNVKSHYSPAKRAKLIPLHNATIFFLKLWIQIFGGTF